MTDKEAFDQVAKSALARVAADESVSDVAKSLGVEKWRIYELTRKTPRKKGAAKISTKVAAKSKPKPKNGVHAPVSSAWSQGEDLDRVSDKSGSTFIDGFQAGLALQRIHSVASHALVDAQTRGLSPTEIKIIVSDLKEALADVAHLAP
jgi:hypothetical protein